MATPQPDPEPEVAPVRAARMRPFWMDQTSWSVLPPVEQDKCADCTLKTTIPTLLGLIVPPALVAPWAHFVLAKKQFIYAGPTAMKKMPFIGIAAGILMTPLNTYHAVRGQCAPDGYMGSYLPALRGDPDGPRWIDPTVWKFMTSKERLEVERAAPQGLIGAGILNGAFGGLGVMLGARIFGRTYPAIATGVVVSFFTQPYAEKMAGAVLSAPHGYLMHFTLTKWLYKIWRPRRGDPNAPVE